MKRPRHILSLFPFSTPRYVGPTHNIKVIYDRNVTKRSVNDRKPKSKTYVLRLTDMKTCTNNIPNFSQSRENLVQCLIHSDNTLCMFNT